MVVLTHVVCFRRPYLCAVLLGLILVGYIGLGSYMEVLPYMQSCPPPPTEEPPMEEDHSENIMFRRNMATQLAGLTRELIKSTPKVNPNILLGLNKIVSQLDPRFAFSSDIILSSEPNPIPDTCEEEFKGNRYGYPFFEKGFEVSASCKANSQKPPLHSLLTILLLDRKGDLLTLKTVIEGIIKYDPHLQIIIGTTISRNSVQRVIPNNNNIQAFNVKTQELSHPGTVWNSLIQAVQTPYTLIGNDIFYLNSLTRLERQIFVISNTTVVGVVGGAFRNESGHWKIGCHVSQIKNYFLKYTEGYQYSAMDCMFCDHLEGPFIAKTSILQSIPFDKQLSHDVLVEDWFLRVKQLNILVMNCPDVMYFKQGPVEESSLSKNTGKLRDSWLAFARKWQVDRILFPQKVSFKFTCKDLQLKCKAKQWVKAMLIPSCCLEQIASAIKALDNFARKKGIDYEIEAGSLLGAVKLGGFLPWDIDGDITFLIKDYNTFLESSQDFARQGFELSDFQKDKYFCLNTPEICFDMWGEKEVSTYLLPREMWKVPTRLKFMDTWVRGEWNPGLFARNRYGPNYLQHVQHWRYTDMGTAWVPYNAGSWKSCPKPHHACLDQYPTDGNIGLLPEAVP